MTLNEPATGSKSNINSLITVTNAEVSNMKLEKEKDLKVGDLAKSEPDVRSEDLKDDNGHFIHVNGNPPRKRSKVSRACDCCRRKKVKCNAEYSSSLQAVTKTCDNCVKNQEECTFSRIPLKRGPSKGYIRDLEEKLENSTTTTPLGPVSTPQSQLNNNPHPPIIHSGISDITNKSNHIILPPINGITNSSKLPLHPMNPSSPSTATQHSTSTPDNSSTAIGSPRIQGPFWKVPYEMPSTHNHEFNTDLSRRSSIDSISSSSTTGIRNLPVLKPSISSDKSSLASDSDDDYYSVSSFKHSRRSSGSLSPRNSISSLSSLNGRMSKVNLNGAPASSPITIPTINTTNSVTNSPASSNLNSFSHPMPQHSLMPTQSQFQPNLHGRSNSQPAIMIPPVTGNPLIGSQVYSPGNLNQPSSPQIPLTQIQPITTSNSVNISAIDQNLKIYYSRFHPQFPILPFNENFIFHIVEVYYNNNNQDEKFNALIDLFNLSLSLLINYQYLNISICVPLIHKITSYYPFSNFGIKSESNAFLLFFSSLVLMDYAVLLNGINYSLPLSISYSIFNDFKVLENFNDLVASRNKSQLGHSQKLDDLSLDNLKLYLPKLYYCLSVIDNCFSLNFGVSKVFQPQPSDILLDNVEYLIPRNYSNIAAFKLLKIVNDLISSRDLIRFNIAKEFKLDLKLWNEFSESFNYNSKYNNNPQNFQNSFLKLIKSKYEIFNFLIEIFHLFNNMDFNSANEEEKFEILNDYLLKLIRLMKNLANDSVTLIEFICKISNRNELVQPLLNISLHQIFKLTKLNKILIDSLLPFVNNEMTSRIMKINHDISIAHELISGQWNLNLNILSITSYNSIKNALAEYNLNFQLSVINSNNNNNLTHWKFDFFKSIMPFVEKDNFDGWSII